MFFIIAVLIAAIFLIILFAGKIKASVLYRRGRLKIVVAWFYIPLIHREYVFKRDKATFFKLYAVKKKKEKPVLSLDDAICQIKAQQKNKDNILKALSYIHSKTEYDIKIRCEIGTGDAYSTALSCGLLQCVVGAVYALRKNQRMKIKAAVVPEFSKQTLRFEADCIIKVSPVNIIIGYLKKL